MLVISYNCDISVYSVLFCKGCPSSYLHWLATLCTFASVFPVESSCVFHQLGSNHISAASAHPLQHLDRGAGKDAV